MESELQRQPDAITEAIERQNQLALQLAQNVRERALEVKVLERRLAIARADFNAAVAEHREFHNEAVAA